MQARRAGRSRSSSADVTSRAWAIRAQPERDREREEQRYRRLAVAASELVPPGTSLAGTWDRALERLGDEMALALAYDGVRFLAELHGEQVRAALVREVLARPVHGDVRDWLADRRHALPAAYERATGRAWPDFENAWRSDLARRRTAARVPSLSAIDATIEAVTDGDGARALRFRIEAESAPTRAVPCTLLHAPLPVYDRALDDDEPTEVRLLWPGGERFVERRLDGRYGRGERVFGAIECSLPSLGVPARLAARRLLVP